jgi:PhzF family phenazine biosynthesis protein
MTNWPGMEPMAARSLRYFQVDAFTSRQFAGNPAGVVLDADGLSASEMQTIARELHCGDTAFVSAASRDDHDLQVRFFSPAREVPFVGHATLAVHVVRAQMLAAPVRLRQLCGIGIVEVDVERRTEGVHVGIRQEAPPRVRGLDHGELETLLDALGIGSADIEARLPVEIYGQRSTRLLLAVRSHAVLARMRPDLPALARLTSHFGAEGYFIFTLDASPQHCLTEARMFCPAIGIPEDAVSGNAHGMLGVYLVRHRVLRPKDGIASFSGSQGASLGRPGQVDTQVSVADGQPQSVRIAGTGVVVFATTLALEEAP